MKKDAAFSGIKNVAPQAQAPSLADFVVEAQARIRQQNANSVFLADLIDRLFQEIMKRDKMISELQPARE